MAGVPTQHRGGGSNATTIGMIVSIIVNVLLLAALIFLYTNQEQLRTERDRSVAARQKLAGPAERAAKDMFPEHTGRNKTLVGVMMQWINTTAGRLTGNQNDSLQNALTQLDGVLQDIRDANKIPNPDTVSASSGAVSIIQGLHQLYADELAAKEEALANLDKAHKELDAALAARQTSEQTFTSSVEKLDQKVATIEQSKHELEDTKNADMNALRGKIRDKQTQVAAAVRRQAELRRLYAQELSERDGLIGTQAEALSVARGPLATEAQPRAVARKPVGRVLRALPGDSLVHVDIGKRDNVTLGMSLAVYSADRRVPENGRGKANIEVVSVGETTAECSVITPPSPDDPILVGDGVGNIVLNRTHGRKTRFCVVGEFDIDGDGFDDPRGLDAIRALVARYGGEVVSEVDADTDYLIVGNCPEGSALSPLASASGGPADVADAESIDADDVGADDDFGDDEDVAAEDDEGDDDEGFDDEGFEDEEADDQEDEAVEEEDGGDDDLVLDTGPSDSPLGIDHTVPSLTRRKVREGGLCRRSIRRAMALSIPRLTVDHFLNFVGTERGKDVLRRLGMDQ